MTRLSAWPRLWTPHSAADRALVERGDQRDEGQPVDSGGLSSSLRIACCTAGDDEVVLGNGFAPAERAEAESFDPAQGRRVLIEYCGNGLVGTHSHRYGVEVVIPLEGGID